MRCIFVLDILNGAVVHAVRGERSHYEPVDRFSEIVSTSEPLAILREIAPREVYIADLNLIMGRGDNLAVIKQISSQTKTMADTGVSRAGDLDRLPASVSTVLGTETASMQLIEEASRKHGIIVSIDMKNRKILSRDPQLSGQTPLQLLKRLNDLKLQGVILLELDRVGTSTGLDMQFLENAGASAEHPLILGGGVKGEEDLGALEEMSFSGALIATALHNGRIPAARVQ
ncbi:MAG TPA: HisA/HisF-related TIM barrel protein [Methanothrix sp.]|nr:HisA/HisF-related TIM barrel protein [Methanothrix sp.]